MMRWLVRWLLRLVVALAAVFAITYTGDWAVFKLRGSPNGKVAVNRYVTIPLKGSKQEIDYLGTIDVPCSVSVFPQTGLAPCWQLRHNPNQGITQ
jgi:hypothetical protein